MPAAENRLPQYDEIAACCRTSTARSSWSSESHSGDGGTAAQSLLNTKQSLGALRNQVHRFRGIPVVVTYHPARCCATQLEETNWDDVRIASASSTTEPYAGRQTPWSNEAEQAVLAR